MVTNYASDSDTESFHSFNDDEPGPPASEGKPKQTNVRKPSASKFTSDRFPPEEEASLLAESNSLKGSGNQLFGTGSFQNAVQTYDRALASCPNYLDYEIAVLRSNVAACHLKLEEWKEAIESATKGIDCLERLEPLPEVRAKAKGVEEIGVEGKDGAQSKGEIVEEVDEEVAARIENLSKSGRTLDEIRKLQIKLLLRRAKARSSTPSWANLQGADEDYRVLLSPTLSSSLSPTDRRAVTQNARDLGPKLNAAKEREMAEMMKNLKGIGNSILKPFGLSTENFKFEKDAKTGGYSMGFEQHPGGGGKEGAG